MSDPEIYRRLELLEKADQELSKNLVEMTIEIRLMAQSVSELAQSNQKMQRIDEKFTEEIKVLNKRMYVELDKRDKKHEDLKEEFDKNAGALSGVKFIAGAFVIAIIGLAVTAVFGGV